MSVNIIWQYEDASHISGDDQDLGRAVSGEETNELIMLGHFETNLGITLLEDVGFYIGPYDGIYEGAHSAITDYNDLIEWGNIRPIPLLDPTPQEPTSTSSSTTTTTTTTTTTSTTLAPIFQRGFLINQQPNFPEWGWQVCNSLQGSVPENAITLHKNATTPTADDHGVLVLGSTMKIKVKISLPAVINRIGIRQVSLYTVYSYTS